MNFLIKIIFLFLFSFNICQASGLELNEVYINYKQFFPGGVDPLITENGLQNNLDKELNLHINMDFLDHFYWNNLIHSMTDVNNNGNGQFRLIGWNFNIGLHITDYVDFGYHHFSQHLLDYQGPPGYHFPVQDAVELNVFIFRKRNEGKGLF